MEGFNDLLDTLRATLEQSAAPEATLLAAFNILEKMKKLAIIDK
jgi:hypothetical protein